MRVVPRFIRTNTAGQAGSSGEGDLRDLCRTFSKSFPKREAHRWREGLRGEVAWFVGACCALPRMRQQAPRTPIALPGGCRASKQKPSSPLYSPTSPWLTPACISPSPWGRILRDRRRTRRIRAPTVCRRVAPPCQGVTHPRAPAAVGAGLRRGNRPITRGKLGRHLGQNQRIVEAEMVAFVLLAAPHEKLWDRFDARTQSNITTWLCSIQGKQCTSPTGCGFGLWRMWR
jgi:hypothetical protein